MNAQKIAASMKIALRALRINKMRSALTMLGIIIGVAAVIAMVAVGSGAEQRIQEQIASIGSNVIIVLSGSITSSGIRMGTGNAQTLTEDDARAIVRDFRRRRPARRRFGGERRPSTATTTGGRRCWALLPTICHSRSAIARRPAFH